MLRRALLAAWLAAFVPAQAPSPTRPIEAPTIAEIFVEEGRVRIQAEVELQRPDSLRDLELRGDGRALKGRLTSSLEQARLRLDNVTGEVVSGNERALTQVWEYKAAGRPKSLTISGPRIAFIVYHLGLPVTDLHFLEGEQTLDLDWGDPWNSRFRNPRLRRQYDARVSAFLYIEPFEVRVEVLARPRDLEASSARVMEVGSQPELQRRIGDMLARSFQLEVDGELAEAPLDSVHFLRRGLWNNTVVDPPEELDARSATVGATFALPTRGYPRTARVAWKRFDPSIRQVAAAATDEAGPRPKMLTPVDNVLAWENLHRRGAPNAVDVGRPPGRLTRLLPLAAGVCSAALVLLLIFAARRVRRGQALPRNALLAGFALLAAAAGAYTGARSSSVSDENAGKIVHGLLFNVYRAFHFRDENTVYDLLAGSVSGDLLRETYLQTRRSLELRNQGGARVRVKQVEIQRAAAEPEGKGFRARCLWTVAGSVGHWGHIHQRRNQYEAIFRVAPVDGSWKITGMELLTEERLLPELPGA
ncbi:MAG: hypothetical protein KIT09_18120 [Bryobacteraceae bacterium]|nr:hypothetical protein [Bryobacteraceae bacterium]